MKTKETVTICPAKYTPFTRIRPSFTVMDKTGQTIGPMAHKLRDKSYLSKRLLFSRDVAPHQCPRESPAGGTGKKDLKIITFKAGMYMKTNKSRTKCMKRNGHFRLSFGHFRQTDTNSAEIRGELRVAYNNPHENKRPNHRSGSRTVQPSLRPGYLGQIPSSPASAWCSSLVMAVFRVRSSLRVTAPWRENTLQESVNERSYLAVRR
jgi:hypothetical protein